MAGGGNRGPDPWKVGTLKVDFGMFRQINRPSRRHQRIPEGQICPFSLREVCGSSGSRFQDFASKGGRSTMEAWKFEGRFGHVLAN